MTGFRDGLLPWTIPAGRWGGGADGAGGTEVRVSVLIPVAGLAACVRTGDLACGVLVAAALLLFAALLGAGRCAASAAGGDPVRGLLLWPLGTVEVADAVPVRRWTVHAAGPVVGALATGAGFLAFRLLDVPVRPWVRPGEVSSVADAGGVVLLCGGVMTAAQLLPAWPLAAGRVVRDEFAGRYGARAGGYAAARAATAVGVVALVAAAAFGRAWAAAAAACVLLLAREVAPPPRPRVTREDDRFLGYDFSAGYTSLDRSAGADEGEEEDEAPARAAEPDPAEGFFAVWRRHRAAKRAAREAEADAAAEADVDRLLAKISAEGAASLTAAERRALRRAAARFRTRPRG